MERDITPDSTRLNWAKFEETKRHNQAMENLELEKMNREFGNPYGQIVEENSVKDAKFPTGEDQSLWDMTVDGMNLEFQEKSSDKADYVFSLMKVGDGPTSEAWKAYFANSELGGDYPLGEMWISTLNDGEGGYP